jgi:hypothetical protein
MKIVIHNFSLSAHCKIKHLLKAVLLKWTNRKERVAVKKKVVRGVMEEKPYPEDLKRKRSLAS